MLHIFHQVPVCNSRKHTQICLNCSAANINVAEQQILFLYHHPADYLVIRKSVLNLNIIGISGEPSPFILAAVDEEDLLKYELLGEYLRFSNI